MTMAKAREVIVCSPKSLPAHKLIAAAAEAVRINPANHPPSHLIARALGGAPPTPSRIAILVSKRWPATGVQLTVGFLDNPPADLRKRILLHMNAWSKTANVKFIETKTDPQVRIARLNTPPDMAGYWSYIGTEILSIDRDQPTLNLQDFTMKISEKEFHRVVRHETGHTLGFPHEHMRGELVNKIDAKKAIAFFGATQGWSPDEVRQQVLTPLEEASLLGTVHSDPQSIMCYQIPGSITKDGKPIIGGIDIDKLDFDFAGSVYPKLLAKGFARKVQAPAPTAHRGAKKSGKKAAT
jgi:hypothetical protein